jgi:hypothetical protein
MKAEEANLVFQALRAASRQRGALEDPHLAKEMDIILVTPCWRSRRPRTWCAA